MYQDSDKDTIVKHTMCRYAAQNVNATSLFTLSIFLS